MSACRDVVVLLPGITGSVLVNTSGREVWSSSLASLFRAVTSLGQSIQDLQLAADGDPGGVTAPELIQTVTIIPGLIKIDGYSRIEQYLLEQVGLEHGSNFFPFPYDWRLDNRITATRLRDKAFNWLHQWRAKSGAADAKLVLVGHSMGGLVSRYFLECLGGWQETRTLFTFGTPYRGSLNAVDSLVHGLKKGIGPLGIDLSPLLRSCPSVYQLLPIYPCVDVGKSDLSRVADAAAAGHLPQIDAQRARAARAFHQEIEDAQIANAKDPKYKDSYRIVPLVGTEQPTYQSASVRNGQVELVREINGEDLAGDGTVPRVSATPIEIDQQHVEIFAAEMHGSLQNGNAPLLNLKGVIFQPGIDFAKYRQELFTSLTLDVDDVVLPNEPLRVRAKAETGRPQIRVELTNVSTNETSTEALTPPRDGSEWRYGEFNVTPGVWRVRANAIGATPVTDLVVVASE